MAATDNKELLSALVCRPRYTCHNVISQVNLRYGYWSTEDNAGTECGGRG